MAKHYRHHRKHTTVCQPNQPTVESTTQPAPLTDLTDSTSALLIKHDLMKTLFVTGALILLLIVISYLNAQHNWTLPLGSQLYQLLHIR